MATRKLDAAWMHGTEVEGNKKKVKCNYCSKVIGGITRFKEHLAIIGTDVTGCPEVTSEVSEEMRNSLEQYRRQKVGQGSRGACSGTSEESLQADAHTRYRQTTGHALPAPVPQPSSACRLSNDVLRAVGEDVHRCHNQLVLQQQHWPPSNVALTNAYHVHPNYQVRPIAFEALPTQVVSPSSTVTPSRLSATCQASGSGYGVWSGYQSTPLNELQCHAGSALLEAHDPQQMGPEQKTLPLLINMFDEGTSSHQTTDNAAPNGQDINLELQLGTKPPSPM